MEFGWPSPSAASSSSRHLPSKTLLQPSPTSHLFLTASNNSLRTTASPTLPRNRSPTRRRNSPKLRPSKNPRNPPEVPFSIHTKHPHAICREIQKLARQGEIKDALSLLDCATQQGRPVNVTTFSALIAACIRSKSSTEATQIHTQLLNNGLGGNEFLRTKLVQMFTSCGAVEDAHRAFDDLPCKSSVYPWNALLRGGVVAGRRDCRNVLSTFSQMRELGVELNVYALSCVLKSIAGAHAFGRGLQTHALLMKNGLIASDIVSTSLMDVYFKCGKSKLARQLFDEIPERDVVAWGAVIAGLAHNGHPWEALDCLRRMGREGVAPNAAVLTAVLPSIGDVSARTLGREVHAFALKNRSCWDQAFIQSAMVDMYCKCGDMGLGRSVFYASRERNLVSWTALISGYISNGKLDQALRSIVWMQQEGFVPDVVTVATVLPVCAKLKALKQGKEMHGYIVRHGFLPNVSLVTSLMVMYSKCGIFGYSSKLFHATETKNLKSWTAMIESHIENRQLYEALDVFKAMGLSKHKPDAVSIARALSVCGQLRLLNFGKEIHGHSVRKWFAEAPFVSAELVRTYGTCCAMDKAKLVFDSIPLKGLMTWTAMIEAYGSNGQYEDAIDLFFQMESDGFSPNHYTLSVVLSVCLRAGFADQACQIFNSVTARHRVRASEEHYTRIIELLTRVGRIEEAQRYSRMKSAFYESPTESTACTC